MNVKRLSVNVIVASAAVALLGTALRASETSAPASEDVWSWNWAPYITVPLAISPLLYLIGMVRMWHRQRRIGVSRSATTCFWLGWLSLLLALDSPLHEWSEQLFWVHMTHPEIL